jgi:hypothetical protein
VQALHDLFGPRGHGRHGRPSITGRGQLGDVGTARTGDLVARDVRLEAYRLVDSRIDDEHLGTALEQPVAQERVLDALRVQRPEQNDGHACSASGSTPRKRR